MAGSGAFIFVFERPHDGDDQGGGLSGLNLQHIGGPQSHTNVLDFQMKGGRFVEW